ncbi:MAG: hypothetical protein LPK45_00100, partial [Bacteroidota bacterium]|nr:hypothetical protein [Bacteroidota bacterium]MDX5429422.1 hypothetical protein [Bacteroidota bacterium]MDX5468213.1 hypothetical protein [Bacteroidota bacterium]
SFSGNADFQNQVTVGSSGSLNIQSGGSLDLDADFGSNSQGANIVNSVTVSGSVELEGSLAISQTNSPQSQTTVQLDSGATIAGSGTIELPPDSSGGGGSSITGGGTINGASTSTITPGEVIVIASIGYPVVQASNLQTLSYDSNSISIQFIRGSGTFQMVLVSTQTIVNLPQDGVTYTANDTFGQGTNLGNNTYVVSNDQDSLLTIKGLSPGTLYYIAALGYNGTDTNTMYRRDSFPNIVQSTSSLTPTIQAYNLNVSGSSDTSISISWTRGNGDSCLVLIRQSAPITVSPTNQVYYAANSNYGLGANLGQSTYAIYRGTGTSVTIQGLSSNRQYYFTVIEFNGGGSFSNYLSTNVPSLSTNTHIRLDLTLLLEGPFDGQRMTPNLNSVLPDTQTYNRSPWNYNGMESVTSIPNDSVVDWVLIELRQSSNANSAIDTCVVGRRAAFLLSNGKIVDLDGVSPVLINTSRVGRMYCVVYHRTHLPILSSDSLIRQGNIHSFDFTAGSAYGNSPMKQTTSGKYVMYGGKATPSNSSIGTTDAAAAWSDRNKIGYYDADVNLDGIVDAADRSQIWNNQGTQAELPN